MRSIRVRPDEFHTDGVLQVARYGEFVSIRSAMSSEEHSKFRQTFISDIDEIKLKIDDLVAEISDSVTKCDPLIIMKQASVLCLLSLVGRLTESDLSEEHVLKSRVVEYVQSVLVSSACLHPFRLDNGLDDAIISKIIELYQNTIVYTMKYVAKERMDCIDESHDLQNFIMMAQMMRYVRGKRYAHHDIENLRSLLCSQDNTLRTTYGVGVEEIVKGYDELCKSIIRNTLQPIETYKTLYDMSDDQLCECQDELQERVIEQLHHWSGYEDNDVAKVTGWPNLFMSDLSFGLSTCPSFTTDEYAGWPIRKLPVQTRPFISVDDKVYCFDLYSLRDNFYRSIQKAVVSRNPDCQDIWQTRHSEATEYMAVELLRMLFASGMCFTNNYYKIGNSNRCENDICIDDHDIVIIAEVKGGRYINATPLNELDGHISSLKALALNPSDQCKRLLACLYDGPVDLHDDDDRRKATLNASGKRVYCFSITLDGVAGLNSIVHQLPGANIQIPHISITIDDLRVYAEYFESKCEFVHYLTQRVKVNSCSDIRLWDELEHLGMYIKHNQYSEYIEQWGLTGSIGYTTDLDMFFTVTGNKMTKPQQFFPKRIREIIDFIDSHKVCGGLDVAISILDCDYDTRSDLDTKIDEILVKQRACGRVMPLVLGNCVFFIYLWSIEWKQLCDSSDYTLANLLNRDSDETIAHEICLYYNMDHSLAEVYGQIHHRDEICADQVQRLHALRNQIIGARLQQSHQKGMLNSIGRNDRCPCGSRKKYKNCHGKS